MHSSSRLFYFLLFGLLLCSSQDSVFEKIGSGTPPTELPSSGAQEGSTDEGLAIKDAAPEITPSGTPEPELRLNAQAGEEFGSEKIKTGTLEPSHTQGEVGDLEKSAQEERIEEMSAGEAPELELRSSDVQEEGTEETSDDASSTLPVSFANVDQYDHQSIGLEDSLPEEKPAEIQQGGFGQNSLEEGSVREIIPTESQEGGIGEKLADGGASFSSSSVSSSSSQFPELESPSTEAAEDVPQPDEAASEASTDEPEEEIEVKGAEGEKDNVSQSLKFSAIGIVACFALLNIQ